MMTFFGSGPSAATMPSASRMAGNAKNTSMTRPMPRSTMPPRYPDISPSTPPTTVAIATDTTETCTESRAPKRMRLSKSRPNASVPSGSHTTTSATRTYASTITRPMSATGSRTIAPPMAARPAERLGTLREADSGIQVAIQQIHQDVHCDEEDGDHEHSSLHERVVPLDDRGEQHPAYAGDREDLLDDDGAAEELTDLDAEQRDHDDETVLQHVPSDDQGRLKSLRPRGADVVGAEHVEHRGARHAHGRGGERDAERDRGEQEQAQVTERVLHEVDVAAGVG